MDQFLVPQFIEVEDKIFGPVTTRQFIILLLAGLILFIVFKLTDTALFIFLTLIIGGFALILAFVKINGQAFHYFILNLVQTLRLPSRRVWYKKYDNADLQELINSAKVVKSEPPAPRKTAAPQHIRDLSLRVNTGGYYKGE
jgi:PrgI family protein